MGTIKETIIDVANEFKKILDGLLHPGEQVGDEKFFGTEKCLHCGISGNVRSMTRTEDGAYICDHCRIRLPENFCHYTKMNQSGDVKAMAEYVDHAERTLDAQYTETSHYENLYVDNIHGLIRINRICYEMKNIKSFRFSYKPLEAKNGLINAKVQGDVILVLNTVSPALHIEEVMARDVQAKARLDRSTDTYYYEYPPTLDAFFRDMESAVKRFKEASEY